MAVDVTHRSGLGTQLALTGQIAVAPPARLGLRARIGDFPRHDGDQVRAARADGAALASFDLSRALTLDVAGGLGGYDLAFSDAGLVVDVGLTTRFGGAK